MHRRVLFTIVCSWVLSAASFAQEQRKTPKKPEKPFTVFVFTEGLTNEDVDMPKVTKEVANRVNKKKWLDTTDDRDSADMVIEVLTHAVHEQHRTELDMRVNYRGTGKSYYDNTWLTERHRIEARVTLPTGAQRMITGADEREKGGSVKGAASHLANQLEDLCKENYWDYIGS